MQEYCCYDKIVSSNLSGIHEDVAVSTMSNRMGVGHCNFNWRKVCQ